MPNIKDIAKAAGVSATTVSNVLNKRGNVSSQKILLVEQAAARMGYRLNENASALRSGQVRVIAIILPDIKTSAYADLYEGVSRQARRMGYASALYVTRNVPEDERRIISEVASSRAACVLAVTSLKDPASRYEPLKKAGARVLLAERAPMDAPDFLGFDMGEAARNIALRVLSDGARRIGLMTNMLTYPNEALFSDEFQKTIRAGRSAVTLSAVATVAPQYLKRAFCLTQEEGSPDAIVTTCEEMADAVLSACRFLTPEKMPRLYTLAPARLLANVPYERYSLDYRLLGERLAKRVADNAPPARQVLSAQGFRTCAPVFARPKSETLTMLTLDNPYTDALRRLLPNFSRATGINVRLVTFPSVSMRGIIATLGDSKNYDLVRMDMAHLSWLGESILCPLEELPLDLDNIRSRLLPELFKEYTDVSGAAYALPLDPTAQLLFYRQDLFEDEANRRTFYEMGNGVLRVPKSYAEFARVAQFFDRRFRPESKTEFGCVLTHLAQEHIAMLLAQTENRTLDSFSAPAMENVFSIRAQMERAAIPGTSAWWAASIEAFAQGRCALCMVYANYAELLSNNPLSRISGRVGFAPMPGGTPMLGGGVVGITKASGKKEAASRFLEWIYSEPISRLLALLSGSSPCVSAYLDAEILDNYPWLAAIREGFVTGARRTIFPNVKMPFDQIALEEQIGALAFSAVRGAMTSEQALKMAARAYAERR